jgi:hypothetical protein
MATAIASCIFSSIFWLTFHDQVTRGCSEGAVRVQ